MTVRRWLGITTPIWCIWSDAPRQTRSHASCATHSRSSPDQALHTNLSQVRTQCHRARPRSLPNAPLLGQGAACLVSGRLSFRLIHHGSRASAPGCPRVPARMGRTAGRERMRGRIPEKRKVGGSIPPLPTILAGSPSAVTSRFTRRQSPQDLPTTADCSRIAHTGQISATANDNESGSHRTAQPAGNADSL